MSNYLDVIKDKSIQTFTDKLRKISMQEQNMIGKLAGVFLNYEEKMAGDMVDEREGSQLTMQLSNVLLSALRIEDNNEFNDTFKFINITFNKLRDSSLNEFKLQRFVDLWDDERLLATYQIIVGTITLLCDPNTRIENKKIISLDTNKKPYLIDMSLLKPEDLNRIALFYDLKID